MRSRSFVKCVWLLCWICGFAAASARVSAQGIPLIDAHTQLPGSALASRVIPAMNEAGVSRAILSFHGDARGGDVLALARQYPDRITPSIKIKGTNWQEGGPAFTNQLQQQLAQGGFGAIGEALVFHARKGKVAPLVAVDIETPQFTEVLAVAQRRRWPLVIHIEFRAAPGSAYMAALETLLARHRDVVFPLIHMGQLDPASVQQLIAAHPNVAFLTSHSNPVVTSQSAQPWTNMFAGGKLKPEWRELMVRYPDRFILAFDNVFPEHWGSLYGRQAALWQSAFADLPPAAAHKIAHQNAERLWRLPPASSM